MEQAEFIRLICGTQHYSWH